MSSTPISPKVTASAIAAIIAGLLLANISLITPDLFAGLGKWAGLAYALTIAVITTAAGWLKTDPLREAGKAAQDGRSGTAAATPADAPSAPATTFPKAAVEAAAAPPVNAPAEPVTAAPIPDPAPAAPAAPATPTV